MKKAVVFWFTGLSGSGKTTTAIAVKRLLEEKGFSVLILDGDDVRNRLHVELTFSAEDVEKNNLLIAQLCQEERSRYDVMLVPIISPQRTVRRKVRELLRDSFFEVYFNADLETVIKRDSKGLYRKAKQGEIVDLIGFSKDGVAYESPENPDYIVNTVRYNIEKSVKGLYEFIIDKIGSGIRA